MILPPATLAMLGGGQLGRFFVVAARELGYKVWVLDPDKESPAGRIADRHLCAAYDDMGALAEISAVCAAVTTEFENVPAATLAALAEKIPVRPGAKAVAICQNRVAEKTFLREGGFPHGEFIVVEREADIEQANAALFPGILKVARFGYDGKGQAVVENRREALAAFQAFKGEACVLEAKLKLDYEVSVVLARDEQGRVAVFPPAENQHTNGILDVSIAPARADACLASDAEDIAGRIAAKLDYIGVLAVEFFVCRGRIYVNEMAPRPHNSGHYTLDACVTSQYEQQVRALCGLPLGEARAHSASVMVNLLGDLWFTGEGDMREPEWIKLHAVPGLKLHLYGKRAARPGRKMGHFTVIGDKPEAVLAAALAARRAIGVING
ncbi:MAG: 5-(carboxyamino)imidazole ribonucleotide synthase [Zoogloeaceae bacterium]|jgi:5-(carboxyamino)imidazole ribonucleotide synthase|nr:5-(carboxyamino)imidazole ribonucleotide synthase [Zoogloeaceae bacterium]